jgi:hypothetical protein
MLLSTQLLTEVILGLDFLINYETEISFPERRITITIDEEVFNFEFIGAIDIIANNFCDLGLMSIDSQPQHLSTTVKKGYCYNKNFATDVGDESVQDWKRETDMRMEDSKYLLDDNEECECLLNYDDEALMQQKKGIVLKLL